HAIVNIIFLSQWSLAGIAEIDAIRTLDNFNEQTRPSLSVPSHGMHISVVLLPIRYLTRPPLIGRQGSELLCESLFRTPGPA
ncbi:hypothetical protein PILCRDRAFT_818729, partial [Piloderma croceum F 1598]